MGDIIKERAAYVEASEKLALKIAADIATTLRARFPENDVLLIDKYCFEVDTGEASAAVTIRSWPYVPAEREED